MSNEQKEKYLGLKNKGLLFSNIYLIKPLQCCKHLFFFKGVWTQWWGQMPFQRSLEWKCRKFCYKVQLLLLGLYNVDVKNANVLNYTKTLAKSKCPEGLIKVSTSPKLFCCICNSESFVDFPFLLSVRSNYGVKWSSYLNHSLTLDRTEFLFLK